MKKVLKLLDMGKELRQAADEPSEGAERLYSDSRGMVDIPFLLLTVLLVMIGLIMVFSASYARAYSETGKATVYFAKQAFLALVGLGFMAVVAWLPSTLWLLKRFSMLILAASTVLLVMVLLFGTEEGGAKRWIFLGFTSFQPSEFTKVAIVVSFAAMMSKLGKKMQTYMGVVPFAGILGFNALLLWMQPHFSAIIIICGIGGIMMFVGGIRTRALFLCLGAALLGGVIYLATQGYAMERLTASNDLWDDPSGSSYQIIQSLLAIGSGGLMGTGLGRGRQKYLYLPEEHNDYIFAIVCEELGLVGALVILLLFALLIIRGFWIAVHARDRFCNLLAAGIMSHFALQVFFNIGVVTNFLPATGISLPLFSYGGTALIIQLVEIGIVLNVSRWSADKVEL